MRERTRNTVLSRSLPLRLLVIRAALFALLWWLLTEGQTDSWFFGIPVVILATVFSTVLAPPIPRSIIGLLQFVPFFLSQSLRGGVDVAWRALHPSLPIAPILVDYPLRLPDEQARVFLANTVSLLPGTLSVRLESNNLQLHVLDGNSDYRTELETLERLVAALFMLSLKDDDNGNV